MGIDNPDVKLVIQWDIPMSFDSMIQRMGRARRKGAQPTFVFFSPKWWRRGRERAKNKPHPRDNRAMQASGLCGVWRIDGGPISTRRSTGEKRCLRIYAAVKDLNADIHWFVTATSVVNSSRVTLRCSYKYESTLTTYAWYTRVANASLAEGEPGNRRWFGGGGLGDQNRTRVSR